MKRLTYEGNFCDIAMCWENPYPCDEACSLKDTWERLKDIEDILGDEYELERLREMVEAEKDGRHVVLPCKVGDTVYMTHRVFGRSSVSEEEFRLEYVDRFGKTVFLTREDAEEALAAGKEGGKDHA